VRVCLLPPVQRDCVTVCQFICSLCLKWKDKKHKHGTVCHDCHNHPPLCPPSPAAAPPPSPAPPQSPLFPHSEHSHSHLSPIIRSAAVVLKAEGHSTHETAKMLSISERSVRRWESHFKKQGNVKDDDRSGRPRITDEKINISIAVVARVESHNSTPKQVKRKLDLQVSPRTVRRRLDEAGCYGRVEREEQELTANDLRRRLSFAHGYKHWTTTDWERVIFSDEKHFTLGQHGQRWVQRPKGQAYNPEYTHMKNENSTLVTIWGCFAAHEIGQAEIFEGDINGKLYCSILEGNLKPTYKKFFPHGERGGQWYFQQDNDPSHTSSLARQWFHRNGVTVLEFPPWSADLNPIENLWSQLQIAVDTHNATDEAELEQAIEYEWSQISTEYLTKLVHSMPQRLQQVIDNKGHKIHY
jgi:transposase